MSLYSSETCANAVGNKHITEQEQIAAEVELCAESKSGQSWCYLFVHHAKVNTVSTLLEQKFKVFIHKSIVYTRKNKQIQKEERASVSGLLFVQGDESDIQSFLDGKSLNLHLVRDCSTGRPAVIADKVMRPFMMVSHLEPTRIRFMPHPFGYYSQGNTLVRITSGVLAGLEGYRIRISRERCLITSVGGMGVAVKGIHKDSFENIDEYVRQRHEEASASDNALTPVQAEIHRCFFCAQNRLDAMGISRVLVPWVARAKESVRQKRYADAVEVALFVLEEIGRCFFPLYNAEGKDSFKDILPVCAGMEQIADIVSASDDVPTELKETVETGIESLIIRFPFLPIG